MRVAIMGTGNVGGAIAHGLKGKSHSVTLGARDPRNSDVATLAAATGAAAALPAAAAMSAC